MVERKNYSYAYTEELVEQVRVLLSNRVTTSPTTAARMVMRDNDLEYSEEIGRWYRRKFQQDTVLTNTVTYKQAQEREIPKSNVYLITSAQNSTPIQENLLTNMKAYAKHKGASIAIIASRFRNPSLYDEGLKKNYWDKRTEEYLIASRYKLCDNLIVASDLRIPYTTSTPCNTLEKLKGGHSYIGGHPKQDMRAIPTLDGQHEKYVYTTGSLTLPDNYSDTSTGAIAKENHCMGFLVVEVQDTGHFTVINVEADHEGNFIDRTTVVTNGVVEVNQDTVEVMVVGDSHIGKHDRNATLATSLMITDLNPSTVVLHDVLSAESVHYYNRISIFEMLKMRDEGRHKLRDEIDESINYIRAIAYVADRVVIPQANHHDIVDKWLDTADWKKDPDNARLYLELASIKADNSIDSGKGVFAHLIDSRTKDRGNVITLSYNDSYRVLGTEFSQHGNIGLNGARGSARAYLKTGVPHHIAHGHTPYKDGDVICVGTNSLARMGYNKGYSGWRRLNSILTKNKKSQYIQVVSY